MSNEFDNLEAPAVQTRVDPASAHLGDLVTLSIRVTHPQALVIEAPALPKNLGTFEVWASTRLPAETSGDKSIERFQATLQNFTTGQELLPPIEISFKDPLGKTHSVKTSSMTVAISEIRAGPKDKGDIRGFKGVIGPIAWSPWWWVLLVALLLAAGAFAWHKRKRVLEGPPPPPPIPPDVDAIAKLEKLAATDWLAAGKAKEYYSAISDILREYLEKAFSVMALERTTSELMRDIRKKSEIPMALHAELRELLETCDLVKFAKFRPEVSEGESAHASAVKFVEETRDIYHDAEEKKNELR